MGKLKIQKFYRGQVNLDWKFTCSIEQVLKLGLLGYLDNISELRLRQYLILRETKVLGSLTDYKLENYRLYYKGQAKEVKLQLPQGVTELGCCFENSGIEALQLRGKKVVNLQGLVGSCKLLKDVLVNIDFLDECVDLSWCFRGTLSLQWVIFNKAANSAKIEGMFKYSNIKGIRLSDYVLNVEDDVWNCFYDCEKLVNLDCSGVKFNKSLFRILGYNPRLEIVSFRNCWFGGEVALTEVEFLRPVTIDLRGARGKGIEKVKSLSLERKSNKAVDEFIKQFELDNVTLILD